MLIYNINIIHVRYNIIIISIILRSIKLSSNLFKFFGFLIKSKAHSALYSMMDYFGMQYYARSSKILTK